MTAGSPPWTRSLHLVILCTHHVQGVWQGSDIPDINIYNYTDIIIKLIGMGIEMMLSEVLENFLDMALVFFLGVRVNEYVI